MVRVAPFLTHGVIPAPATIARVKTTCPNFTKFSVHMRPWRKYRYMPAVFDMRSIRSD